jgi:hypothetical protein
MADPIEAHYTLDGDEWTVAVQGRGRTLTGRAPGLIAARDMADQLVTQLTPEESGRKTVVHMLNGDAVEFTTAYLTARLARTEDPPAAEEPNEAQPGKAETNEANPNQDTPKDSPEADNPTEPDKANAPGKADEATQAGEPGKGDEPTQANEPAEADATTQANEPATGDALAEADKPADDLGEATEAAGKLAEPGPNAAADAPDPATSTKAGPEAAPKPTPTPRAESPTSQPAPAEETAHSST